MDRGGGSGCRGGRREEAVELMGRWETHNVTASSMRRLDLLELCYNSSSFRQNEQTD